MRRPVSGSVSTANCRSSIRIGGLGSSAGSVVRGRNWRGAFTPAIQRRCDSRTWVRNAVSGVAAWASVQPLSLASSACAHIPSRTVASNSGIVRRQWNRVERLGMAGSAPMAVRLSPSHSRSNTSSAVSAR
ncbi:MAG: hypothetical protein U1C74_27930 [Phenylobacterium sp.]|nr:hypothetical protein [Phenylobacterium sp.]